MSSTYESILINSSPLQETADSISQQLSLLEHDPSLPLERIVQLDALEDKLHCHIIDFLGKEQGSAIQAYGSGITDCSIALNGIVRLLGSLEPTITGKKAVAIAHNSFGIVKSMARRKDGLHDLDLVKKINGFRNYTNYLHPDQLELINGVPEKGLEALVRIKDESDIRGEKPKCPAFVGKTGGMPRLGRHVWTGVVNVYAACGEFGPIDAEPSLAL